VEGYLSYSSAEDYYRLVVPTSQSNAPENLLVTIWGENGAPLNPWIDVDDAFGNELNTQVFTANGNTTILQVSGLQPGGVYYIGASSDTGTEGEFELSADVGTPTVQIPLLGSGTLTSDSPQQSGGFTLTETAQVHLALSATGSSGTAEMIVTNQAGQVVADITSAANRARSIDMILAAGQYTVTVQTLDGSTLAFEIGLAVVTDPVGAQPSDPTSNPQPASPPPPLSGSYGDSSNGDTSSQTTTIWENQDTTNSGQNY
jgi:hypothetical protein